MKQKTQLCLALDTASDTTSVACLSSTGESAALQETLPRGQGEFLFQMIQQVLQKMNKKTKDLTLIAATIGPGSFTGVRIGLATARGLGLALNIPVLGVDNFQATASLFSQKVKVVLESKRDDYFVQTFDKKNLAINTPSLETTTQLKKELPFLACGSGAQRLAEEIGCDIISSSTPLAFQVAKIALHEPNKTLEPHPLYLREADVSI